MAEWWKNFTTGTSDVPYNPLAELLTSPETWKAGAAMLPVPPVASDALINQRGDLMKALEEVDQQWNENPWYTAGMSAAAMAPFVGPLGKFASKEQSILRRLMAPYTVAEQWPSKWYDALTKSIRRPSADPNWFNRMTDLFRTGIKEVLPNTLRVDKAVLKSEFPLEGATITEHPLRLTLGDYLNSNNIPERASPELYRKMFEKAASEKGAFKLTELKNTAIPQYLEETAAAGVKEVSLGDIRRLYAKTSPRYYLQDVPDWHRGEQIFPEELEIPDTRRSIFSRISGGYPESPAIEAEGHIGQYGPADKLKDFGYIRTSEVRTPTADRALMLENTQNDPMKRMFSERGDDVVIQEEMSDVLASKQQILEAAQNKVPPKVPDYFHEPAYQNANHETFRPHKEGDIVYSGELSQVRFNPVTNKFTVTIDGMGYKDIKATSESLEAAVNKAHQISMNTRKLTGPMVNKRWGETNIRLFVQDAVKRGVKTLYLPTGEQQVERWGSLNPKLARDVYDNINVQELNRLGKKFGAKVTQETIPVFGKGIEKQTHIVNVDNIDDSFVEVNNAFADLYDAGAIRSTREMSDVLRDLKRYVEIAGKENKTINVVIPGEKARFVVEVHPLAQDAYTYDKSKQVGLIVKVTGPFEKESKTFYRFDIPDEMAQSIKQKPLTMYTPAAATIGAGTIGALIAKRRKESNNGTKSN